MLRVCLGILKDQPQYAYKLYAYKKKTCSVVCFFGPQCRMNLVQVWLSLNKFALYDSDFDFNDLVGQAIGNI